MTEKDRLRRALSTVLDAEVTVRADDDQPWHVGVAGIRPTARFRAIWVRRGWPADVGEAIKRAPDATLVVAPALSPGARDLLADRGLNWADETGGARIQAPGLIVRLDGEPVADPKPQKLSWSPIAVQAAEAVLSLSPAQLTTGWLAEHARCSVPRASGILQQWDAEGWTTKRGPARGRGASRTLDDVDALLGAWTAHLNAEPTERWFAHTASRDLADVQQRLTAALGGVTFAWSGWFAAEQLAPFVTQMPVLHLRVAESHPRRELEHALRDGGVTMTADTGRIEIWRTTAGAFEFVAASVRGPLCSWPRVYADLQRAGGRAADAAEHLRAVMTSQR